jgi:hypothetical protein
VPFFKKEILLSEENTSAVFSVTKTESLSCFEKIIVLFLIFQFPEGIERKLVSEDLNFPFGSSSN